MTEDDSEVAMARLRLHRCDAALATGDFSAARAAIDIPLVWSAGEIQTLARLAAVYLEVAPRDDAEVQRASLACALYLDARRMSRSRGALLLAEHGWPEARLAEIARAAEARLLAEPREGRTS